MIGTDGGGNTFPGASLPFGMIQWSPDTNRSGFYSHNDSKIRGFSLTHLSGVGCPIYADVPILPWSIEPVANPATKQDAYTQAFDHSRETARPGYYRVVFANGIDTAIAVTERAGIASIRFPAGQKAGLLINPGGGADTEIHMPILPATGREQDGSRIAISGDRSVSGSVTSGGFCGSASRYTLFFAIRFEQPVRGFTTWRNDGIQNSRREAEGKHAGAWLDFSDQREIRFKVGISYVSEANAFDNLDKEIPDWDFERVRLASQAAWTKQLSKVSVDGGTPEQRKIFYTGLYHMLLDPTLFSDHNHEYVGFDRKEHTLAGTRQTAQYANFSDWDTYRNTIQLQALLEPERVGDMMQSLVNDAEQSGWLPRWPQANDGTYVMGGDSADILLSSAHAFGVRNFDTHRALQFMVKGASETGKGVQGREERMFLPEYLKHKYMPIEEHPIAAGPRVLEFGISASRTLEYANDDFAIAQFAHRLGDAPVYSDFLQRSLYWRNLFDPQTRWIRPRYADGSWVQGFDAEKSLPKRKNCSVPTDQEGFEEGGTYQYTFMIPFDYPELFRRMGGEQEADTRLDRFFSKLICWGEPCFNMANEPDFVTPYAYIFAGKPWKTQQVLSRIEHETFSGKIDGIPGNDDLGATSGVYVWNALGLYPGVPGIGGLFLGAPIFSSATIQLSGGRELVIRADGTGPYVQQVLFNGQENKNSWLPLANLKSKRNELHFTMGPEPNRQRGKLPADRPPSFVSDAQGASGQ